MRLSRQQMAASTVPYRSSLGMDWCRKMGAMPSTLPLFIMAAASISSEASAPIIS